MDIKNIIFTIILILILNFSVPLNRQYQPGREKTAISYVISVKGNNVTADLLKLKEKTLFADFISCYYKILLTDRLVELYNSS
jgi:hypothetical protein